MHSYQEYKVYIISRVTDEPILALAEPAKRTELIGLKGKGWLFTWTDIFRKVEVVYKITLNGILQGLIGFFEDLDKQAVFAVNAEVAPHNRGSKSNGYVVGSTLFAIAAQCSLEWGQDGYVFLEAKTKLIGHYAVTLGAKLTMPPQGMSIDEDQAQTLIESYIAKEVE